MDKNISYYNIYIICRSERLRADFKIMQSLDEYTKVNPAVRQDKIIEFIDKINSSKSIQNVSRIKK